VATHAQAVKWIKEVYLLNAQRVVLEMERDVQDFKGLEGHEKVEWVRHPSLASHPDRAVADRLLKSGWGGMLSFKPRAAEGVDPLDAMRAF